VPWLLDGIAPAAGLTIIAGRPKGARKSWTAYLAALAIASGKPLGPFTPNGARSVLYFNGEGVETEVVKRFDEMLLPSYGIDPRPLQLYMAHGEYDEPLNLSDEVSVGLWVQWAETFAVECVVIDPFASYMDGNENDNQDMGKVVKNLRLFNTAGIGVILVHHLRKQEDAKATKKNPTHFDPDMNLRGSTKLAGAYDSIISFDTSLDEYGKFYNVAKVGGKYFDHESFEWNWKLDRIACTAELVVEPYVFAAE
jgi:RecA-family ATPase